MNYRAPLALHVVWHPGFTEGINYANNIYRHFSRPIDEPLSRGTGLQVFNITTQSENDTPFARLEWNVAMHHVIIILTEENITVDEKWENFLTLINAQTEASKGKHIIVPVLLREKISNPPGISNKIQQIRLIDQEDDIKEDYLIIRLAHILDGFITNQQPDKAPPKINLFLSHAKLDGKDFTTRFNAFIKTRIGIDVFFDVLGIEAGYDFDKQIITAAGNSALLIIQTDAYSSRPWCRKEVIAAKNNKCPVIIYNEFKSGEKRSFPYMSNVPVIRSVHSADEDKMFAEILKYAMIEFLRFKYQMEYLSYLNFIYGANIDKEAIFPSPPELLTILSFKNNTDTKILYPDPLLGDEEMLLLSNLNNNLKYVTPQMLPLLKHIEENNLLPLTDLKAGISISPTNKEFGKGLTEANMQDAMVNIARHILAGGATLVYGGSLNSLVTNGANFTQLLFDLVAMYNNENTNQAHRVLNFTIFPYSEAFSKSRQAELFPVARMIKVPVPEDISVDESVPDSYIRSTDSEKMAVTARLLTVMREAMNEATSARIFMGGKIHGFDGRLPGVFEEACLAIKSGQPVYLAGAYGGCTSLIINFLDEFGNAESFASAFSVKGSDRFKEIVTGYELFLKQYPEEVTLLSRTGIGGLRNGLSEEENRKLMSTIDLTEITQLILKGLLNNLNIL